MPPPIPRALTSLPMAASAARRTLATATTTSTPSSLPKRTPSFQVFNRHSKYLQRERSVRDAEASRRVDYLRTEVAERLVDKLMDISRDFPTVLDLGAHSLHIAKALTTYTPPDPTIPPRTTKKITNLYCTDTSPSALHRDLTLPPFNPPHPNLPTLHLLPSVDEEHLLTSLPPHLPPPSPTTTTTPFQFDAILSSLTLHWTNDLPHLLTSLPRLLAPDSPFIAAILGGDTLFELRTSLQLAEQERRGGVSPHVSPLADTKDIASLLQAAGFKMLTIDIDDIVVLYPDIFALMADLQQMGEGNVVLGREEGPIGRDVLMAAEGVYRELHGEMVEEDGVEGVVVDAAEGGKRKVLPATFRVIYMIGWSEGPNQPKPLKRGSGQVSMKDILGPGASGRKE